MSENQELTLVETPNKPGANQVLPTPTRNELGQITQSEATSEYMRGIGMRGGRPPAPDWKAILDSEVNEKAWRKVVRGILKRAARGDVRAAEFLADHRFGKPVQRSEIEAVVAQAETITVIRNVPRPTD